MKAEAQASGGTAARALPDGMLPSQRALFDIPREICYLNAASWSPLPIATQEAGRLGVARKGKPWAIEPTLPQQQFERARRAAARLINAETEDVALISSVSYGVATAAKLITVPASSRVLVLENDHRRRCWNGRLALARGGSPSRPCHGRRTAIGPRPFLPRSKSPARPPSPLPPFHRCTGPTAGWSRSIVSPRGCADKERCF